MSKSPEVQAFLNASGKGTNTLHVLRKDYHLVKYCEGSW